MQRVTQNSVRVVVLVISMPGKKCSGAPFQLHTSEKELLELWSSAFRYKNTLLKLISKWYPGKGVRGHNLQSDYDCCFVVCVSY
jgi:hypothetical protein